MTELKRRIFGLIGHPVGHSLSPFIMHRAFVARGMEARYVVVPVTKEGLGESLRGLETMEFDGVNVTYPLKEAVLEFASDRTVAADVIGAANTLTFLETGIHADNTDATGTLFALETLGGTVVEGKRVFVFGAGGAGRAAAYGLLSAGATAVTFGVRDKKIHHKSIERLSHFFSKERISKHEIGAGGVAKQCPLDEYDVVINATPVGMDGSVAGVLIDDDSPINDRHVCFEFVYNPRVTPFMESAARHGAQVLDGLALLVAQASASFERWTGKRFSLEEMYAAVRAHAEENETHSS